jgi:hypothetical protein
MAWELDQAQLNVLQTATGMGANCVQAFVNSPPFFWTESGSSKGARGRLQTNLRRQHDIDFAKFIAQVVNHYESNLGIRFHSFSAFNEPSSPAWVEPSSAQEGCRFSYPRALGVLKELRAQPCLHGKLSIFEEFCVADSVLRLLLAPKRAWQGVRHVFTHTYDSRAFTASPNSCWVKALAKLQDNALARWLLRRIAKARRLPLWVSEYGQGNNNSTSLADKIMRDLVTLKPSAWVYWQAVEDISSDWGLLQVPFGQLAGASTTVRVSQQYEVMRVYARHLKPGSSLYKLSDKAVAAYNQASHTLSAVLTHHAQQQGNTTTTLCIPCGTGRPQAGIGHWYNPASGVSHSFAVDCTRLARDDQGNWLLPVTTPAPGGVAGVTLTLAPRQVCL